VGLVVPSEWEARCKTVIRGNPRHPSDITGVFALVKLGKVACNELEEAKYIRRV